MLLWAQMLARLKHAPGSGQQECQPISGGRLLACLPRLAEQWLTAACPLLLQRPPQGFNITVFHSMHAEVENYQVHHWTVSMQLQHGALQQLLFCTTVQQPP